MSTQGLLLLKGKKSYNVLTKFWFLGGNQKDERPNESYYYGTYAYNTSFYEQNLDILGAEYWVFVSSHSLKTIKNTVIKILVMLGVRYVASYF